MYKKIFENKKVIIFDLETIIEDIDIIYTEAFRDLAIDINQKWLNIDTIIKISSGVKEICSRISKDPYAIPPKNPEELEKTAYPFILANIEASEELNVVEGFWAFLDELKNTYKFKVILKSEFNEEITKSLLEKCDLKDIFDLVIFQSSEKPKNLYTEIVQTLKPQKIKPKECITFEKYPEPAQQAYIENLNIIIIRNPNKVEQIYPNYFIKREDFSTFIGNINKTSIESFGEENMEESEE